MNAGRILALCGGVGGAKLAAGLAAVLPGERLTIAVNTGDDFEHLGLAISPDIDTVLYTLGGLADRTRGWGTADESWNFMDRLAMLGGPDWFALGDRDLALHVWRTHRLSQGAGLGDVTAEAAARFGIAAHIVPMTDDPVRTRVVTGEGDLAFQDYFVARRCEPVASAIRFEGAEDARPAPAFLDALNDPALAAVIVCPSNPYLSIDPILALPGIADRLSARTVPRIAVSPIVGGAAVKGPTTKLMRELGVEVSQAAIAAHYHGLIDTLVLDTVDAGHCEAVAALGIEPLVAPTLMRTDADRAALARAVLAAVEKGRPA